MAGSFRCVVSGDQEGKPGTFEIRRKEVRVRQNGPANMATPSPRESVNMSPSKGDFAAVIET